MYLYKIFAFIAVPCVLLSNPKGELVVHGNVAIQGNDKALHITASDGAIIHWKDFSIDAGQRTQFIQPSTQSIVTNKVIEANPSKIMGHLEANGKVFLINPAGILVGKKGSVHAGAFIASTLEITPLKEGTLHAQGDSKAAIINLGHIKTLDGDALLIGHVLENHGTLEATNGTAGAIGFQDVLIKPQGSNRFLIQVSKERLAEQDVQSPYALAFSHPSDEEALPFLDVKNTNPESDFVNTGTLCARTDAQKGGQVLALADNIFCYEGTLLDVSDVHGEGEVLIGGDYKAQNTYIPLAQRLFVLKNAQIQANATQEGKGGKVILWSEQVTYVEGRIEARGGDIRGDGGFIEISGKKALYPQGEVQTSSPNGKSGTLLLDPVDITVTLLPDSNVANPTGLVGIGCGGPGVYVPPNYTFSGNPVTIDVANLQNVLESCGNVIIDASAAGAGTGTIAFTGGTLIWTSANSLTLLSPTTFTSLPFGDITCTGTGNITVIADGDISLLADIYNSSTAAVGGDVSVTSNNGSIFIGDALMIFPVRVGAHRGTTSVSALGPASDIILTGGQTGGGHVWAIIGEETQPGGCPRNPAIGDINVRCTRDLILQAGTNIFSTRVSCAMIGKSAPRMGCARVDSGNINIDVGRDIKLFAGVSPTFHGTAIIGHGAVVDILFPSSLVSNITINAGRNVELFGGINSGLSTNNAYIGMLTYVLQPPGLSTTSTITMNVGENLWLHSQGPSFTFIGGRIEDRSNMFQTLYLNVGANMTLDGLNGFVSVQPLNFLGNALFPPDMFVHVGGDLVLRAGNVPAPPFPPLFGPNPIATFQQDNPKNTQVWVGGNIRCYNGLLENALIHHTDPATFGVDDIGDFDARAGGDILVGGGIEVVGTSFVPQVSDYVFTLNPATLGPAACQYEADHVFAPGELWPAMVVPVGPIPNIFTGTPLASASGNTSTTAPFNSGGDGLGAIAYNTFRYDTSATPSTVNGFPLIAPVPVGPFTPPTNNRLSYLASSDIFMLTSDRFDNGTPADGAYGPNPAQAMLQSTGGDITISSFRNTLVQFLRADLGNILVVTENNLSVDGSILAFNRIDLVCDNQFPVPPLIGPASFTMTALSTISSGASGFGNPAGYLRIYTARQPQNSIHPAATFNGLTFTPGLLFVNTSQEGWCIYFPNVGTGTNGIPFTIYYKDCFAVPPITQANLIVSEFITDQFIVDLFMDGPFSWSTSFRIFYDRPSETSLSWSSDFSGFELLDDEKYWQARRKIKKIQEPNVKRDWDL